MSNDTDGRTALVVLAIQQKAERGARLTKAERVALWADKAAKLDAEIRPLLKAGKVGDAINRMMCVIAAHSVSHCTFYDELEDRIAALEAAAKPRHRVKAPIRLVT